MKIGEAWRPYRTVACWYLWRSLENERLNHMKRLSTLFAFIVITLSLAAPRALAPSAKAAVARPGDAKKWDVTADLGPAQKLAFDTSEGTWMNVDVSPDGTPDRLRPARRHLHDADRGQRNRRRRRASRSGPAFDMQPRFSPDGKRVAFTSDRDGLWNIWTMDPDGKNPKPGVAREAGGGSTARPGRLTATTSSPGATSSAHARSGPARSGCSTHPDPTACR